MPFIGQDWRSPGENWVKTSDGWERLKLWRIKLLESLNQSFLTRLSRLGTLNDTADFSDSPPFHQPYIHIPKRSSRESLMSSSVCDIFNQLDMCGSVRNLQRFNYVCKVTHFMIYSLPSLSGSAQKVLFQVLQEIMKSVIETGNQLNVCENLLVDLIQSLQANEFITIGSAQKWKAQLLLVKEMKEELEKTRLVDCGKHLDIDSPWCFADLPDDCIRLILCRLSNHVDIVSLGLSHRRIYSLSQESLLWRQLVFFHFPMSQIRSLHCVTKGFNIDENDWQALYLRLYKRYGLREVYADMLQICSNCNSVFWKSTGHPCKIYSVSESPPTYPMPPPKSESLFPQQFVNICVS